MTAEPFEREGMQYPHNGEWGDLEIMGLPFYLLTWPIMQAVKLHGRWIDRRASKINEGE